MKKQAVDNIIPINAIPINKEVTSLACLKEDAPIKKWNKYKQQTENNKIRVNFIGIL